MTRVIEGKHSPGSRQPLTIRQRIFVEAYIADPMHSGKAAAIEAGYSQRRAHVTAHRLLRKRHVRAAIDRALRPQLRKYRITRARVLRELAVLAFSDILDYRITGDGQIELTGGASTRATRAVSVFRCRRSRTTRGNGDQAVTLRSKRRKSGFGTRGEHWRSQCSTSAFWSTACKLKIPRRHSRMRSFASPFSTSWSGSQPHGYREVRRGWHVIDAWGDAARSKGHWTPRSIRPKLPSTLKLVH